MTIAEPLSELSAEELIKRGYRRTSNKFCILARIDREDWLEFMADEHPNMMRMDQASLADFYRRVYSKDKVTSPASRDVPSSNHDPVGYVELEGDQHDESNPSED